MSSTIWIISTIPRQTRQTTSNFHYLCKNERNMKKVEVYPAGFKVYDDNDNLIGYEGNNWGEGFIYKDYEAFHEKEGICYVCEFGFRDNTGFISVEDAEVHGETHETIVQQVKDAWGEEYMLTDEQAEYFAENVLELAEWACIATYLAENFDLDDSIEYDGIRNGGIFTKFQHEAVANGQTPNEYADRQLSYGELMELDNEFDEAFVVDEDCEDDWSDKGLGANARLTYVEQRRTGLIDGPEDFDCDIKWRRTR